MIKELILTVTVFITILIWLTIFTVLTACLLVVNAISYVLNSIVYWIYNNLEKLAKMYFN